MRARTTLVAGMAAAVLAAGCGGSDPDGAGAGATTSALQESPSPTAADLRIVALVEARGERLDLTAARLLGDVARLDAAGLRLVAPTRAGIAARMLRGAEAAAGALAPLTPRAALAGDVASAGAAAFSGFGDCARDNVALWRAVRAGSTTLTGALDRATVTCTAASGSFEAAEAAIAALPEPLVPRPGGS